MDGRTFCNQTQAHCFSVADTMFLTFNCTVLTFTLVLGLPWNLWVCWVVFRTKSLRNFNNALLVSLAASDLLKCSVDTPLLLFSLLRSGRDGRVPVAVCALQQFTFALCSCAQLLTLVSISVERFQAIAFPFQTEKRRVRVRLWILSIWACGLILAVISLTLSENALFYTLCRPHVGGHGADRLRGWDPFGAYVLVPLWGLCLSVIVVHYARIFKVVRQHRKKVFNRGIELGPTVSRDLWGLMGDPASAPRTAAALPSGSDSLLPPGRTVLLVAEAGAPCTVPDTGVAPVGHPEIVGAVCFLTSWAKERGKKQVEGKLAKRFGYIIIAFTLSWVPMVTVLLVDVLSWQDTDKVSVAVLQSKTISGKIHASPTSKYK